jgi:hypothetical protein
VGSPSEIFVHLPDASTAYTMLTLPLRTPYIPCNYAAAQISNMFQIHFLKRFCCQLQERQCRRGTYSSTRRLTLQAGKLQVKVDTN